jgi:hypothetical protein
VVMLPVFVDDETRACAAAQPLATAVAAPAVR